MFDFYEKRKIRGVMYSKPAIAVLFLFGLFLSTSVYERYKTEVVSAEKRTARAEELVRVQQRAAMLETKVNQLESDRGKEAQIREQFDVKKGNEEVVVIVDDENKRQAAATDTAPATATPPLFHWLKFW